MPPVPASTSCFLAGELFVLENYSRYKDVRDQAEGHFARIPAFLPTPVLPRATQTENGGKSPSSVDPAKTLIPRGFWSHERAVCNRCRRSFVFESTTPKQNGNTVGFVAA